MKTQSDRAMEAIAEGDYIASINATAPGATFNNDPACFARYCNMQANAHQEFPLIAEDMRQARDIADPTFRTKAQALGMLVSGTHVYDGIREGIAGYSVTEYTADDFEHIVLTAE